MTAACEFDHLVVGAHTLEQGATFVENLLGVGPQAGGRHLAMGTHNMLLRLGARAFLEVMAIDPAGTAPARPRWFGFDDERIRGQLRNGPRLLAWAARTRDIDKAVKNCPIAPGTVHPIARGAYTWRITIPDDGAPVCGGLLPALLQWDGDAHPAEKLADRNCELMKLEGFHPAPASIAPALAALGLAQTLPLAAAAHPRLTAIVRCPYGIRAVTS